MSSSLDTFLVKLPQSDHLARTREPQLLTPSIDAIEDIELPFSEAGRPPVFNNGRSIGSQAGVWKLSHRSSHTSHKDTQNRRNNDPARNGQECDIVDTKITLRPP